MSKHLLWSALIAMLASVLLVATALLFTNWRFPQQSSGRLIFAETYKNGTGLNKIVLTTPQGTITLQHDNNYWAVKEADYYYADIDLLNRLLTDFNSSTYYSEQPFSTEAAKADKLDHSGILVQTYQNDQLLNSVIIGKAAKNPLYHFARNQGRDEIWLIDGDYALPEEFYSWIMQPVSELPPELVEKIEIDGTAAGRNNYRQPFSDNAGLPVISAPPLLEAAAYINAEAVASGQNFDTTLYPDRRSIKFTTFQGLIVEYQLCTNGNDYWLSLSLSTTPLPKQAVNAYIKDNRIFYDGWYFKIPAAQGKLLFSLQLV